MLILALCGKNFSEVLLIIFGSGVQVVILILVAQVHGEMKEFTPRITAMHCLTSPKLESSPRDCLCRYYRNESFEMNYESVA